MPHKICWWVLRKGCYGFLYAVVCCETCLFISQAAWNLVLSLSQWELHCIINYIKYNDVKKPRGRPIKPWIDVVKADLQCGGYKIPECLAAATDKTHWLTIIDSCVYPDSSWVGKHANWILLLLLLLLFLIKYAKAMLQPIKFTSPIHLSSALLVTDDGVTPKALELRYSEIFFLWPEAEERWMGDVSYCYCYYYYYYLLNFKNSSDRDTCTPKRRQEHVPPPSWNDWPSLLWWCNC